MLYRINKLLHIFSLALLMSACGGDDSNEVVISSDGGPLTLSTPVTGQQVASYDKVLYTLEATAGTIYEFKILSNDGPIVTICEEVDCPSGSNSTRLLGYQDRINGIKTWYSATATTLYIYITGTIDDLGNTYDARYDIEIDAVPTSSGGTVLTLGGTISIVYQNESVAYTLPVSSGNYYQFHLKIGMGDVNLLICTEADCNEITGSVIIPARQGDSIFVQQALINYDGQLYIYVQGIENSVYHIYGTQTEPY